MIKYNVLRKNLLTNEMDYGNVDSEFEAENLNGNIVQDSPWVEISEDSDEGKSYILPKLKIEKIKQVKLEAAKRIESAYPQYKQLNNGAAVLAILNKENYAIKQGTSYTLTAEDHQTLIKAKACQDFINLIRSKSDELETLINSKRTIGTLTSINISDDIYWS